MIFVETLRQVVEEHYKVEIENEGSKEDPWYRFNIETDAWEFQGGEKFERLYLNLGMEKQDFSHDFEAIIRATNAVNETLDSSVRLNLDDGYFNIGLVQDSVAKNPSAEEIIAHIEMMLAAAKSDAVRNVVSKYKDWDY